MQHILGVTVTHQDMEAIDPDYYKNLLQITTLPLEDLGLDLTFSADTEMFGALRFSLMLLALFFRVSSVMAWFLCASC